MKRVLLALALLAVPVIARAATKTCEDYLLRQPARTYDCVLTDPAPLKLKFKPDPTAQVPTRFRAISPGIDFLQDVKCICDSKGKTLTNPKNNESTSFTCIQANETPDPTFGFTGFSYSGRVYGKDGSKIALRVTALSTSNMTQVYGTCRLLP